MGGDFWAGVITGSLVTLGITHSFVAAISIGALIVVVVVCSGGGGE